MKDVTTEAEKTHNAMTRITGGIIGALGIESSLKLEDDELERIALWVREKYETPTAKGNA